nr:hypothetical protein [Aureimonas sp. N4]
MAVGKLGYLVVFGEVAHTLQKGQFIRDIALHPENASGNAIAHFDRGGDPDPAFRPRAGPDPCVALEARARSYGLSAERDQPLARFGIVLLEDQMSVGANATGEIEQIIDPITPDQGLVGQTAFPNAHLHGGERSVENREIMRASLAERHRARDLAH